MAKKQFGLTFGCLAPSVSDQIMTCFGIGEDDKLILFDKLSDAINLLDVRSIITESETRKARQRLMKEITQYLRGYIDLKDI